MFLTCWVVVVVLVLLELLVGNLFIAFLSTGSVLAVTLNIFQHDSFSLANDIRVPCL